MLFSIYLDINDSIWQYLAFLGVLASSFYYGNNYNVTELIKYLYMYYKSFIIEELWFGVTSKCIYRKIYIVSELSTVFYYRFLITFLFLLLFWFIKTNKKINIYIRCYVLCIILPESALFNAISDCSKRYNTTWHRPMMISNIIVWFLKYKIRFYLPQLT